jgi:spore coat protein CotF
MQSYTDKEILGDALASEKASTNNYNTFANECANESVRNAMLQILEQEHSIQKNVFDMMHAKGFYPTPAADMQKVEQAKQKYSASVKMV